MMVQCGASFWGVLVQMSYSVSIIDAHPHILENVSVYQLPLHCDSGFSQEHVTL